MIFKMILLVKSKILLKHNNYWFNTYYPFASATLYFMILSGIYTSLVIQVWMYVKWYYNISAVCPIVLLSNTVSVAVPWVRSRAPRAPQPPPAPPTSPTHLHFSRNTNWVKPTKVSLALQPILSRIVFLWNYKIDVLFYFILKRRSGVTNYGAKSWNILEWCVYRIRYLLYNH